jgi:hypothetical protein
MKFLSKPMVEAIPTPWGIQMWIWIGNNGTIRSRNMLLGLQHSKGRGAFWSSKMALGIIDKL